MPYSNKQRQDEYNANYKKEHYTAVFLRVTPDDAEIIRAGAAAAGLSLAQYVISLVKADIARRNSK